LSSLADQSKAVDRRFKTKANYQLRDISERYKTTITHV
jgi:hypothetical protein